jgi:hypothetical protein
MHRGVVPAPDLRNRVALRRVLSGAGLVFDAWQNPDTRLAPGMSLTCSDEVLRAAEATWTDALGAQGFFRAYIDAVHETYPVLAKVSAAPDLAGGFGQRLTGTCCPAQETARQTARRGSAT